MVSSPLHHTSSLLERFVKVKTANSRVGFHQAALAAVDSKRGRSDNLFAMQMTDESNSGSSTTSDVAVNTRKCQCTSTKQKHVAFGEISSRSYEVVIGDHPCCNLGCPLSLGWEYNENPRMSVEEFEASRSPRRCLRELKTTWDQRRTMLTDVSEVEVKRAERKLHRERSCQRKVRARTSAAFFSMDTIPEDCNSTEASSTSTLQHDQTTGGIDHHEMV